MAFFILGDGHQRLAVILGQFFRFAWAAGVHQL
jgi:hypothetical protein